jgi:lipoate-protein ligase A
MSNARLILDEHRPGAENMAFDYSLLRAVADKQSLPVLRLYGWKDPTLTIGYFQSPAEETDANSCAAHSVQVIRRITGGGAVFHEHEITYSIVYPLEGNAGSVLDSYALILAPIVQALKALGLDAVHAPVNDILVAGRKISGSAQTRRHGVLLQHGTIILDIDREKVFSCLTVPAAKSQAHQVADPGSRVVSLKEALNDQAMDNDFVGQLRRSIAGNFALSFGYEFNESGFTADEIDTAASVVRDLFDNPQWNLDRKAQRAL